MTSGLEPGTGVAPGRPTRLHTIGPTDFSVGRTVVSRSYTDEPIDQSVVVG